MSQKEVTIVYFVGLAIGVLIGTPKVFLSWQSWAAAIIGVVALSVCQWRYGRKS